ncbi:acyl-CoA binding domain-containing protein 6 [Geranomyces variabilis]|uniref:Acyl-CoA binding domain-containing protein 6 n=1 Tax=Geranomyces variabilis TaxID=109894 RepID=A0AAD5TRK1_9FUNG|nr:acyl-CoA binding domain-containing protein 6 [Geranomyces variabilis]
METQDGLLETQFLAAARYLSSRTDLNLGNEIQLELYALFKTATAGPCVSDRPGFFDFRARAKWDAWAAKAGMSKPAAMRAYIALASDRAGWTDDVEIIEPDIRGSTSHSVGGGDEKHMAMAVSRLENPEAEVPDASKTIWDWAREGRIDKVLAMLAELNTSITSTDEQGMTLLHWAADRGHADLMRELLQRTTAVDVVDSAGQTPLHLAVIVEHEDVVKLLLRAGASIAVVDAEGETPWDCASPAMRLLLRPESAAESALNLDIDKDVHIM